MVAQHRDKSTNPPPHLCHNNDNCMHKKKPDPELWDESCKQVSEGILTARHCHHSG